MVEKYINPLDATIRFIQLDIYSRLMQQADLPHDVTKTFPHSAPIRMLTRP